MTLEHPKSRRHFANIGDVTKSFDVSKAPACLACIFKGRIVRFATVGTLAAASLGGVIAHDGGTAFAAKSPHSRPAQMVAGAPTGTTIPSFPVSQARTLQPHDVPLTGAPPTTMPASGAPVFTADSPTTSATAGTLYTTYTFVAAPVTQYVLAPGSYLPPGVLFNIATGELSGTPTVAGSFTFEVDAENGTAYTAGAPITLNVAQLTNGPAFTADTPSNAGTVGSAYTSYTFVATGTPTPTYAVDPEFSLPPGLTLNTTTGVVSGTPTAPGTYHIRIDAVNSVGTTASQVTTVVIAGAQAAPVFVDQTPPATATQGTAYSAYTFVATGSPTPTYIVDPSTSLPPGMSLNSTTGVLSGTPTAAGIYTFIVDAVNSHGTTGSRTVTIIIGAATTTTTAPAPTTTIPTVPTTTPAGPPTTVPTPQPPAATVLVPTGGGAAATPQGAGYWALTTGGILSNHGNAGNFGSENSVPLNAPVVAVNSTTTGNGYWLAASDGGVFAFGDAPFVGSMGGQHLNAPVVAISSTPDNAGYRLAASDGGVFTFGTATFQGSMGGTRLNQPIVGMVSTPSGNGYWLVGSDGGVFSFGDAQFFGSLGATNLNKHIVGIASTPDGLGYWLVAADGGVFTFGDAKFYGSLGATGTTPIVGIVANGNVGYRLITPSGEAIGFGTVPS